MIRGRAFTARKSLLISIEHIAKNIGPPARKNKNTSGRRGGSRRLRTSESREPRKTAHAREQPRGKIAEDALPTQNRRRRRRWFLTLLAWSTAPRTGSTWTHLSRIALAPGEVEVAAATATPVPPPPSPAALSRASLIRFLLPPLLPPTPSPVKAAPPLSSPVAAELPTGSAMLLPPTPTTSSLPPDLASVSAASVAAAALDTTSCSSEPFRARPVADFAPRAIDADAVAAAFLFDPARVGVAPDRVFAAAAAASPAPTAGVSPSPDRPAVSKPLEDGVAPPFVPSSFPTTGCLPP